MEVTFMKKHIVIVGTFLLLVLAFAVCIAPAAEEKKMSKKAAKLMAQALEAIQAKQPDAAIDILRQVISMEPENAMVRHNLGVLFFEKGLPEEAISNFEVALQLQPDYQNALLALRQALFEAGKNAGAKGEHEKANVYLLRVESLPLPPTENKGLRASAYYLLGYNFFNLKQYTKAIEYFSKCQAVEGLEQDSLDLFANATYFLGMMAHIQGQYEASNVNFRKYLSLFAASPAKPEFYSHANYFIGANLFRLLEAKMAKGEVAGMAEATAEILPHLTTAVENKIPSEDAHVMLGNCYVYQKEYEKAVQAYQRLIELFPQSPQLKNYQAFLAELQKMQPPAKKKR
jgi:tetratricopeptide (TPR) repeat protein